MARHPDLSKMYFVFGTPSAVNGCNCTPPILFIVIAKSTDPLNMNIPKTVPGSRQLHSCEAPAPALTTTTTVEADEARCPVKITVGELISSGAYTFNLRYLLLNITQSKLIVLSK